MYTICKSFTFEASHKLKGLPKGHKCGRLHGHSYRVELIIAAANVDEHGFVVDYGDLRVFEDYLRDTLDHRHLNKLPQFKGIPTSAENIARVLFNAITYAAPSVTWAGNLVAVRVYETARTWAEYRRTP